MLRKGMKWNGMFAIGLVLVLGLSEAALAAEKIVIGALYR